MSFLKVKSNSITLNIPLRLLVTPYQNKKLPVYNWYNYRHSYSRDLVIWLIEKFHLNKHDTILDPFCGSGTTLLAARELGISVIGMDILPLSIFISNAKLQKYDKKKIELSINEIKGMFNSPRIYPQNSTGKKQLLNKFFDKRILDKILFTREWIEQLQNKKLKYFFLTALLSILENVSNTRKDGGFLRILNNNKDADMKTLYLSKLQNMVKNIDFVNKLPRSKSYAILGDARKTNFSSNTFSAVITSPPYPNRHDYTRVYLLELIVGFINNQDDIKTLRYNSIRSHVEAKDKHIMHKYDAPKELQTILKILEKNPLPNKQVIPMLYGYFQDMYLFLNEMKRILKKNGKLAIVIGDVRYSGIIIPVSNLLINIGENIGLAFQEKITARTRGNSPQQMKTYGKKPMQENILIWKRK